MPIRDASTVFGGGGNTSTNSGGLLNRFGDIIDNQVNDTKKRLSSGYNYDNTGYYDRSADLRAMWDEWRDTQLASLKKMYENAINGINQNFMSERNQANIKKKLGENWIKSNTEYDSGRLYSLSGRNNSDWINATMNARNEKSRATNTATADYNNQKANVLQAYATRMANLL